MVLCSQVQGRATRRAAGVNGPALPGQRGRERPLRINGHSPEIYFEVGLTDF
jgi:hypothetical protein